MIKCKFNRNSNLILNEYKLKNNQRTVQFVNLNNSIKKPVKLKTKSKCIKITKMMRFIKKFIFDHKVG